MRFQRDAQAASVHLQVLPRQVDSPGLEQVWLTAEARKV